MNLLRADLRALVNLPRDPHGRRLTLHLLFGLGLLGFLSWWIASNLLHHPSLARLLHDRGGDSLHGMLGLGLLPCPIVATWLGLSTAQRQLFESPELPLWQAAPIAPYRGALQILLRATFFATLWASALSLPFLLTILGRSPAGPPAYALLPLAIVTATAPLMAMLLLVQTVLVRLLAGRFLRLLLTFLAAAASIAFLTWLLIVLFSTGDRGDRFVAVASAPESLPWTVDVGARMLFRSVSGTVEFAVVRPCLSWLLLALSLFWVTARLHPGALAAYRLALPTRWRRRTSWPAGIAAVFRRKEFAQLWQQPGALIGFLIFAFLVFALVERKVLVTSILSDHRLPDRVAHLSAMLTQWFLATMLVLYPHMGRIVLWDGAQWSLYRAAPAAPFAILRGKLQAIGAMLLWPILLVAVAGTQVLGASPVTTLWFVTLAVPGLCTALGVLALVGTLPWLVRPDEGRQMAQGGRSFFASLIVIALFELSFAPAFFLWIEMSSWAHRHWLTEELAASWMPWIAAGSWAFGLFTLAIGIGVGSRNFARLLRPQTG